MQTIKQLYRKDYLGEDVVTSLEHKNGDWVKTTEFIPNQIKNLQVSNRALIIGNGDSRLGVDLRLVANHRAGIRGTNRLQTYGCNALYQDYAPDFLVVTGPEIVQEVSRTDYVNENVVYASSWAVAEYPKKFYLIPQNPNWNAGALATYLACFDGHKKIFLLGFDGNDTANHNYNVYAGRSGYPPRNQTVTEDYWIQSMDMIFRTYPDVEFIRVAPTATFRTPEAWKYRTNFRTINFRQFVLEADL
jgi:hypothetical protein